MYILDPSYCLGTHARQDVWKQTCTGGLMQGCQIFLDTIYQNEGKYTKLPQHYLMTIKYTSIFPSKVLQNLPKLVFLVWKQTIWQPWSHGRYVRRLKSTAGIVHVVSDLQGIIYQGDQVGRVFANSSIVLFG
jgi:hypothetical protein